MPRIQKVGGWCFWNTKLKSLYMPDLEVIEERGFVYGDFKVANLPKLRETPGIHHFYNCYKLHTFIAINLT